MNASPDQLDRSCAAKIAQIHVKLDRIDEALRGNGKPGINTRLDRLEQVQARRDRLMWVVGGAFASAGASLLLQVGQMVFGGG